MAEYESQKYPFRKGAAMSASNLIDRIPKDVLAKVANGFGADTTAQQVMQTLADLGIEATEEGAKALLDSLFAKKASLQPLEDGSADAVAGGSYNPYADPGSYDPNWNNTSCYY